MKSNLNHLFNCILLGVLFSSFLSAQEQELLQLRIYHFDEEQGLEDTEQFFEDTYLPALKKRGFERIGVFKNHLSEQDTTPRLYLLLPVSKITDLNDADEEMLASFPDDKHFRAYENIFLKAFKEMPMLEQSPLTSNRSERIYELRSYESATDKKYRNKVEMFNEGGEVELFDQLGFNAVFYGEVLAGSHMPNLMYMTTHKDRETRDQNWKNFSDSPVWEALKSQPKYQKNVSHIDIYMLYPTEYSDY